MDHGDLLGKERKKKYMKEEILKIKFERYSCYRYFRLVEMNGSLE